MAEGGGAAPPPEARRAGVGKGIFAVIVIVVAVLALGGGLALGPLVFPPAAQVPTLVVGTNIPFPPFEDYNTTTSTFFVHCRGRIPASAGRSRLRRRRTSSASRSVTDIPRRS